jgi:hypothetical protein
VAQPDRALAAVETQLSGAARSNRASRATIAFLESDRPDGSGAGDRLGDLGVLVPRGSRLPDQ